MNTKNLIAALLGAFVAFAVIAAPCQAQLFGGGGFRGGGGFGGGGFRGGGGFGGGRPIIGGGGFGGGALIMRPAQPIIQQPIARPSLPAARPIIGGGSRPILGGGPSIGSLPAPSRPVLGDRPILGRPDRPIGGNLPAAGNLPVVDRPNLPGVVRPSQPVDRDRLNSFLNPPGVDRPIAGQLPAGPVAGDRPILGDRPGLGGDRPILGDRPIIDRPIVPVFGDGILGNEIREKIVARRVERAVAVRDRIRDLYYRENHPFMYWRQQMWTHHPVWSWWRVTAPYRWANWSSISTWCDYSGSYAQSATYEYTDDGTYANGKQVVVDDEYSQQARELAAAGTELLQQKIDAQEADKLEWLPLGVYALCNSEDGDPTMFLQLTISREGIIAGSFANTTNNENLSVQGGADRESTRLAVTIGDKDDVVIETGLYNVTEEQSSALVHYQDGTRENWLLVKMPDPQDKQAN